MVASTTTTDAHALRTLLHAWEKGRRTLAMYLPNNPVRQQTIDALREGLSEIWQQLPELTLAVSEAGLEWESEIVLPVQEKSESLAWTLFQDGIRRITFSPGVEEEELITFLGLVQRARTLTDEDQDDLRTLLWSAEFQFIRYTVAQLEQGGDDSMEATGADDLAPRPTAEDVRESIKEDIADEGVDGQSEAPAANAPVNLEDFESTLYFLDKAEVDYLTEEVRHEYAQNLNENVLSMLFDIFEAQPDVDVRSEIVTILGDLLPNFLTAGDFHAVAYLISEAQLLVGGAKKMLPQHHQPLSGLARTFTRTGAVEQLLEALDTALIEPSTEDVEELFTHLTPAVLSTALKWYGQLAKKRVRTSLAGAIARMAESTPAVAQALESSDRGVVIEALRLVEKRSLRGVGATLVDLVKYEDVGIRVALVQALAAGPTPATMAALVTLMQDPDSDVRIDAAKALAAKRFRGAVPKLEEAVLGKELRSRDLRERKAFFEAYATLAGDSGVPKLKGILTSTGFWRSVDPETRACAAMALGIVFTPSAQGVLQRATKDKDPLVRNAVMGALRGAPQ